MTQEIQNYKLTWLRRQSFRVEVGDQADAEKALAWLTENVDEKSWEFSINIEKNNQHTFFFESATDASRLREELYGDSRTVDVS